MNSEVDKKIKDLKYSMKNNLLINLTQKDTTVFYTGVVVALDGHGAILISFDDYGLANGLVYVTFGDIYEIDFQSEDLSKMEGRISLTRKLKLNGTDQKIMKLNQKTDLLTQVLGNSFVDSQCVLIVRENGDVVEGFIDSFSGFTVTVRTVNKFNNSEGGHVTLVAPAIRSIEFLGTELKLLSQSKKQLFEPHIPTKSVVKTLPIIAGLNRARETGKRVIMIPKVNPNLFFIGQVNTITRDAVIFKLVDMVGRFGGYELIRTSEIKELIIESDYLRLINHFVALTSAAGTFKQPPLNDERSFDATVDPFESVLRHAIKRHKVLRIKMNTGVSFIGFPIQLKNGQVTLQMLDKAKLFISQNRLLDLNDIDEIAFGYLDSFMIEKQIKG